MKILTYVPHGGIPDRRGFAPALVASEIVRRLVFCKNFFVCNQEGENEKIEFDPELGDIYRIRETWLYRKLFKKITRFDPLPLHGDLAGLTRKICPDLIHIHQIEFRVNDFRRKAGAIPLVIHNHVVGHDFSSIRGEADAYIAVSEYVRQDMLMRGWPTQNIYVIPNGVDTELFKPCTSAHKEHIKNMLGIPSDAPVLLFFGRKMEVKGYEVFIETANQLIKQYPDLWILAAGPEPADARLDASYPARRQGIKTLRESGRFIEFGNLSHRQLANFLGIGDIALLCSKHEPQGMAMLEAMSSGCCLVSTRTGGIKESVHDGETGILLDAAIAANPTTVARIIGALLGDKTKMDSLAKAARLRMEAEFSWSSVAEKVEKMYFQIARHRHV